MTLTAYDTYINADAYFKQRLHVTEWKSASSTDKTIALIEATQRIDRLRFAGNKVDDSQALEFPRYYGDDPDGSEVVPDDIKIATYELAFTLIDGIDPDLEFENLSAIGQSYSNVRMVRAGQDIPKHIIAGIPSASAWRYLLPYLAPSRILNIRRVT